MIITNLSVVGMTCENCVKHVTEELKTLPTVTDVAIELVVGGTSSVVVTSEATLDDDAIREAVDEAGYALA